MNKLLLSTPLLTLMLPAVTTATAADERPNVLFLFVDDLTYNGIHALGNPELITPNLDALVESGVSFTNSYNMGAWSGAVSVASRSQLMSGEYLWQTNEQLKLGFPEASEADDFMPEVMAKGGYQTFYSGKWHTTGVDPNDIFESVGTVRKAMAQIVPATHPHAYNRPLSKDDSYEPWNPKEGGYWEGGRHWSEVVSDETIAYLEENKESEKPLFLYCAYNAPHDPRQSPKEFLDLYDPESLSIPESFLPENPYGEKTGEGRKCRDEALGPFPRTHYAVQKHKQEYYALITHLDMQIGRIITYLKENDLYDNTLIVFSADHGLAMGRHGFLGKQNLYEHSMKPPLIWVGPGISKGERRDQLVYLQDLVPTIFEYVGVEKPERYQFESMLSAINDKKAAGRSAIYGAFQQSQRMVRNDRYKLYFLIPYNTALLFDLKRDPEELNNLYGDKKYDSIVKELASEYLEVAKECGDQFDIRSIYPDIFGR